MVIEDIGTYLIENKIMNTIIRVPQGEFHEPQGIKPGVLNKDCQEPSIIVKHNHNTFRYSLRSN